MEQPVDAVVRKLEGSRSVVLLKNDDYRRKNNETVYIPNTIEMAQIKKPIRGQYKKNVQFSRNMDEDMVRSQLQEAFPTFDLKNERFSCAAVSQGSITFKFHGTPRVWDGRTIKRLIKGNSVLYIVMERNQVPQQLQLDTATEGCGSSTDTGVNPGNNSIHQTKEQINPMNTHVLLDGQLTLFRETADSNTGIAQTSLVTETEMEVDDSKQGNDDELDTYDNPTSSVNQIISDSTGEDNLLSYFDSLDFMSGTNSESGFEFSPDDFNCSPSQWITEVVPLKVESVSPNEVPLQGGNLCCFTFNQTLPSNVQSGIAMFGLLGNVDVKRCGDDSLVGKKIPSAQEPGRVTVILKSEFGTPLGEIDILYVDEEKVIVQRVVNEPRLQSKLLRELESKAKKTSAGETQDSGNLDFTNPVQVLCLLVYAAAESGAQQFIEMIFNSSAGRIVFDAYKDRPLLPEVIAKSHGNEATAHYLEDITKRFSEETTTGKECPQTIDWSELVNAAEAAEKRLDVTSEKDVQIQKDILKETGYLGDIDTSSSASSEAQSSDSDDDISRTSRKEIQMKPKECKQTVWESEDHTVEANKASLSQSQISFLKDGAFPRGKANVVTYFTTKTLKWKENGLHLIQARRSQDTYNVREIKYLQDSGISFLLGLGNEPVQHHLTTAFQRLGYLLALSTERNQNYKMHVDTAEDHQSLEHLSTTVGNVADYKASRLDALQQLCCRLINGEFTATANREDLTVRGKSAEFLMEHCQSTVCDFWLLTYIFRPTRKFLFFYVADSEDVFPFASCFDDRQYELSWQRQQWQRCKNNVPKVQEICKLPELNNLQRYPPLLNREVTYFHVTKEVCKEQSHTVDEQPFDVVGKPCFKDLSTDHKSKNFERHWHKALYSSVSQNKIAHKTESKDELLVNSLQHKGVQKANNDIDMLVSENIVAKNTSLTTLSLTIISSELYGSDDWMKGLGDILAKRASLTTLSLTIISSKLYGREDWMKGLGDVLAKNTSLTTLSLTINSSARYMSEDWAKDLGDGLAKITSLTTLSLAINSNQRCISEDWTKGLGDGLAKNTSLTSLSLTINSSQRCKSEDWTKGLGDVLAKNTSLTTLSLTINSSARFMSEDWAKGLGDGLAKITSLTTLSLTINSSALCMSEDWAKGLGDGLAKNTSLTTLSLTINSSALCIGKDRTKGLGDGLAKNTSLTTLSLTINSSERYMCEDWTKGLGDGLAKNTSLTTLSLTINSSVYCIGEDWTKGLGDGLAKNTSLTTLRLTISSSVLYRREDWTNGLGDGLAKNTSLSTLSLTINSRVLYLREDWTKSLGYSLARNKSLTSLSLAINSSQLCMSEDWAKGLGNGLAKNTSLTTLSLTINSNNLYMSEDWDKDLGDGLVKNTSLNTLGLTINSSEFYRTEDWEKGQGDSLAKKTSLTTLSRTIDSSGLCISEDRARQLGNGLAKGLCKRFAKRTSGNIVTLIVNGDSYSSEELVTYPLQLSKISPSVLVTLCDDSQLLKRRNGSIPADLEECTLVSCARGSL